MERLPLYDIKTDNIYLIHVDNIFPRILYQHYRMVDKKLFEKWKKKYPDNKEFDKYDWDKLMEKYYYHFYHSYIGYQLITNCVKPSYDPQLSHIKPYFSQDELYYLAYDWDILKNKEKIDLQQLCNLVSDKDIPFTILINHRNYITKNKAIGLVKHYSLFGSYFINGYLRNPPSVKDKVMETQIKLLSSLVEKSPEFDKEHTVYRFIDRDYFLSNLKIGEIFIDKGFISTTRNPFQYQEHYNFGYILIKIKLPKDVKGIGLSLEGYSNFPTEEEIILNAGSKLRLDNVIKAEEKQHEHLLKNNIIKKYEMTWIGKEPLNFTEKKEVPIFILEKSHLLKQHGIDWLLEQCGSNHQFQTNIGIDLIFSIRRYNSVDVYKPFFSVTTPNGIIIYSSNPRFGNINIMIEIGNELRINWYFRHSISDTSSLIDLEKPEWLQWISLFAYFLSIREIIIYPNYLSTKNLVGVYSETMYKYLKNKNKKFPKLNTSFEYYQFDTINNLPISKLKKTHTNDELFQIATKENIQQTGELWLFLAENNPLLIPLLEKSITKSFIDKDPFNIYYKLDAWTYLYENDIINFIPQKKSSNIILPSEDKLPTFDNRLRYYFEM